MHHILVQKSTTEMPFDDIPKQKEFLYDENWSVEKDAQLLRHLIAMEDECYGIPPAESQHARLTALLKLNEEFRPLLQLSHVEERVAFLEGRYECYKKLTRMNETYWDLEKNQVIADDAVWERVLMADPFAGAYLYEGEPEFYKLCLLFGKDHVKGEASRTVILISDSPNGPKPAPTVVISSSPDEEVNSPAPRGSPHAVRKLFPDDAMSSCVPWTTIEKKVKFPAAFHGMPKYLGTKAKGMDESSCASSSPLK